jgi:hypothetical protein
VKRLMKDFVSIFNCMWYRDFPAPRDEYVARSNWTIHIGVIIRECADLLGFHAAFESGNRTDAVIHRRGGTPVANIEWEWIQPFREKVNEVEKLLAGSADVEFSVFISYADERYLSQSLEKVESIWTRAETPLILFLITFEQDGKHRRFCELVTYLFANGGYKKLRAQPALPWEVSGSKWEAA